MKQTTIGRRYAGRLARKVRQGEMSDAEAMLALTDKGRMQGWTDLTMHDAMLHLLRSADADEVDPLSAWADRLDEATAAEEAKDE